MSKICGLIMALGFFILLGAAGASDNSASLSKVLVVAMVGFILVVIGFFGLKIAGLV